jgi:hypothetical protein
MRATLFACCLILATAAPAIAQTEPTQIEAAQNPVATEAPEPSIEEVVVSGEQPGPGLWKVSKGDHVLWILGALQPLPQKMTWRSRSVESVIAESQEVLANTSVDADIGFFKGVMLAPSLIGIRKNPEGATLEEILPADLYARWLTLKARYIGRDSGIEKWRPIFAAQALYSKAIEKSGLTYSNLVWPVVTKIAKKHDIKITTPQITVAIDKPRAVIKEFKKSSLDDIECFAKTLERLETDLDAMRARANAWAVGDVEALSRLPYPDQNAACRSSIMNSQVVQERGFQDVPARMATAWVNAAEVALANNETTFAVLSIVEILRPEGYVAKLRARGYVVEAP